MVHKITMESAADLGGCRGLQPPQIILSSPTHLHIRLPIAWHSSCCLWLAADKLCNMSIDLKPTGGAWWLVVQSEHGVSYE